MGRLQKRGRLQKWEGFTQFNPFVEPVFIAQGQFKNAIGVFGAYAVSDSVLFIYPE